MLPMLDPNGTRGAVADQLVNVRQEGVGQALAEGTAHACDGEDNASGNLGVGIAKREHENIYLERQCTPDNEMKIFQPGGNGDCFV